MTVRKVVRATREIIVSINGEEYDALLIPRNRVVEIDFSKFPEDDPLKRKDNIIRLTEIDLDLQHDLSEGGEKGKFQLTKYGATRLLDSL